MEILNKKFHFIAIGGVGMSALAKYLTERGAKVSGSDISENKYTHLLESIGASVTTGHNAEIINRDMTIIASSAIKESNPELQRAKDLGLTILHRSDALKIISDEFSKDKNALFIGFSGTHGKTTTSGLCSYVLAKSNLHPSFVVGGIIPELNTNGAFDGNKYFCAELDESDGTIKKYSTDIAVINNIEEDHLDFYKNGFSDIAETFNTYLSNKPDQKVIINNDNKGSNEFIRLFPGYNYITFGLNNADYTAKNIKYENLGSEFDVFYKGEKENTIKLSIPGEHNIYNALAVYAAIKEAGINIQEAVKHFESFSGMGRRFQKTAEFNGIKIYDDYAHHPSEIKTTLSGLKTAVKDSNRTIAIFQPHRYSRLKGLWNDFKTSFASVEKLIITDVYSAGENEIEGINSYNFAKEILHPDAIYIKGSVEECAAQIYPMLKENDIVITLGAGNITKLGQLIENEYKKAVTCG